MIQKMHTETLASILNGLPKLELLQLRINMHNGQLLLAKLPPKLKILQFLDNLTSPQPLLAQAALDCPNLSSICIDRFDGTVYAELLKFKKCELFFFCKTNRLKF